MTDSTGDPDSTSVPEIPARFTDPRPVLLAGTVAWLVATVVVWLSGARWADARPVCLMGLVVGLLGYTIYSVQLAAARRGAKTAQTGLT